MIYYYDDLLKEIREVDNEENIPDRLWHPIIFKSLSKKHIIAEVIKHQNRIIDCAQSIIDKLCNEHC